MIRRILLLAVLLAAIAVPARAGVTSNTGNIQTYNFTYEIATPTVYEQSIFAVMRTTSVDESGVPADKTFAVAYQYRCNLVVPSCAYSSFPQQAVPTSAFSVDELGNSGTFSQCLAPDDASPCKYFSLTFARPTSMAFCNACAMASPWFDQYDPGAGAATYASWYVSRYGYRITGTFAGFPFDSTGLQMMNNNFTGGVGNSTVASLP
jgi:hypothetical protein